MALTPLAPDGGLLAATTGDLYTAGANTVVFPPRSICIVNTDSSARTFNLYTQVDATNDYRITSKDQSLEVGGVWYNPGPIALQTGDKLRGDASAASVVSYNLALVLEKT